MEFNKKEKDTSRNTMEINRIANVANRNDIDPNGFGLEGAKDRPPANLHDFLERYP